MRILFAMFHGDGNVPLITPIVAALVARGHAVRVLVGPGVRATRLPVGDRFLARIAATGATHVSFTMPPTHPFDDAPAPRGLLRGWTPKRLAAATSTAPTLVWSPAWADVVAADFVLLGALAAAEAAGVPAVALVHGTYKHRPAPGVPGYGTGGMPARSPLGELRDALYHAGIARIYRRDGLPALNRARQGLGLPPLRSPFDQYDRAARVLILASAAFDFPVRRLPPNVHYVGAPTDDAGAVWDDPWLAEDDRPLVVASLSTLAQGQAPVLGHVLKALDGMPVRALVTTGPSLDPAQFRAPANVRLEAFVPHGAEGAGARGADGLHPVAWGPTGQRGAGGGKRGGDPPRARRLAGANPQGDPARTGRATVSRRGTTPRRSAGDGKWGRDRGRRDRGIGGSPDARRGPLIVVEESTEQCRHNP